MDSHHQIVDSGIVGFDVSDQSKLNLSGKHSYSVYVEIAARIADVKMAEFIVVGESSDCGDGEPESSVVFVLFEEEQLGISVVETADEHEVGSQGDYWDFCGELLVV